MTDLPTDPAALLKALHEAIDQIALHEAENERGYDNCQHNPCPIRQRGHAIADAGFRAAWIDGSGVSDESCMPSWLPKEKR